MEIKDIVEREKWTIRIQNSELGIIRNSDPHKRFIPLL